MPIGVFSILITFIKQLFTSLVFILAKAEAFFYLITKIPHNSLISFILLFLLL